MEQALIDSACPVIMTAGYNVSNPVAQVQVYTVVCCFFTCESRVLTVQDLI